MMRPVPDCDCEHSLGAALASPGRSGDADDRRLVTVCFWCGAPSVDPEAADGPPNLPP
ncbi:MAG: hypothetical protein HYU25_12395 [Candidatus Rokubacteria bacterium]|nr:hypothetical protein [Candidatus Rokubacteria bacterium]